MEREICPIYRAKIFNYYVNITKKLPVVQTENVAYILKHIRKLAMWIVIGASNNTGILRTGKAISTSFAQHLCTTHSQFHMPWLWPVKFATLTSKAQHSSKFTEHTTKQNWCSLHGQLFFFLFQENTPCIEYKSLFYTFHFFFLEDSRVVRHSEHASMFFFSSTEQSSFTLPGNVCKQPFCKKAIVAKLPNRPTQDLIWTPWNIVYALKVWNIMFISELTTSAKHLWGA